MKLETITVLLLCGPFSLAAKGQEFEPARIKRIAVDSDATNVLVSSGSKAGFVQGQILDVFRVTQDPSTGASTQIKTGKIKIIQLYENQLIAKTIEDGTNISKIYFRKFPRMMISDFVQSTPVEIVGTQVLNPIVSASFFDLFVDPKSNPASYELTEIGRQKIQEIVADFSGAKVAKLLVEGHTDKNGPAALNQVESYQRALSIRQFMVDELGFDPERIVAVGLGETETPDDRMVPGYERKHRRIAFKVLNSVELD